MSAGRSVCNGINGAYSVSRRGRERLVHGLEFPAKVIKTKQHERLGINAPEFFVSAFGPTLGQVLFRIQIFSEKAIFIRNAEKIENRRNQIQVGNQHGLREVFGKLLVT